MAVAGVLRGFLAVLDGFQGAPLYAGQALFAMPLPYRLARVQKDVAARAEGSADGA